MSRRAILSLVASVIIGIGFVASVSTDASAYRAGVYRGGAYRGRAAFTGVASIAAAFIVECAPEWRLALVLLSALQRSALLLRVLITDRVTTRQAITAPPLR